MPKELHNYVLAIGSEDEQKVAPMNFTKKHSRYSEDERIGEIRAKAAEIRKQAAPFLNTLSTILKEATGGS